VRNAMLYNGEAIQILLRIFDSLGNGF
jgi:hypothetical protein